VPRKWTRLGVVVGNNSLLICFYGLQRGRERKEVFFFVVYYFSLSPFHHQLLRAREQGKFISIKSRRKAASGENPGEMFCSPLNWPTQSA
jgi:hypothetical protein